ncbi:MAG: hypothetical protein QM811_24275 [Pirellulales bacterium]
MPAGGNVNALPERLLAIGDVTINTPQLNGTTKRLEIWFDPQGQIAASTARAAQGTTGDATQPRIVPLGAPGTTPNEGLPPSSERPVEATALPMLRRKVPADALAQIAPAQPDSAWIAPNLGSLPAATNSLGASLSEPRSRAAQSPDGKRLDPTRRYIVQGELIRRSC